MLRSDKAIYLSFLFKSILSVRLSNSLKIRCFTIFRIHEYSLSDCNRTRTHNHLFCKRTLNHLAKLAK